MTEETNNPALEQEDLHSQILTAITDRTTVEERYSVWYQMRHDGIRRVTKPWKNAADMHYPLADGLIDKTKPYYYQLLFSQDTLAEFTSLDENLSQYQMGNAIWFDYKVKQKSNFEEEMLYAVDYMLEMGKGILKVYYDAQEKKLCHEAIDPLYVIVPQHTKRLADADWVCHVKHFSKSAYERQTQYDQSEDTVTELFKTYTKRKELEKHYREGITVPTKNDQLIVWEVWEKEKSGRYKVCTYSPTNRSIKIRDSFYPTYNRGIFKGGKRHCFFEINYESKPGGYYASRGIPERVAPHESYLNKLQNEKADCMTLFNRPIYSGDGSLTNATNINLIPGSIINAKITPMSQGAPPMSFEAEMNQTKDIAQDLIGIPNYDVPSTVNSSEKRTAAEVNAITNDQSKSVDLKGRVFKREASDILAADYSLLIQFQNQDLKYFYGNQLLTLPQEALSDEYTLQLSGSSDNYNKGLVAAKASQRFQILRDDPYINQAELRKDLLASDDSRLVKRLFVDAQTQQSDQTEDQGVEILLMKEGLAPAVKPSDDDKLHLGSLFQYVQHLLQMGETITPELARLFLNHGSAHFAQLQKKDPQTAKQLEIQSAPIAQQLGQIAQMDKQPNQYPQFNQAQPVPMGIPNPNGSR